MVYFGMGVVRTILPDMEKVGYYYAKLEDYQPFVCIVPLHDGPGGEPWEGSKVMQNSVREISGATFNAIAEAGGLFIPPQGKLNPLLTSDLQSELQQTLKMTSDKSGQKLRKIQRIYEAYERPSAITNTVKKQRGDRCQLCEIRGFIKRNGTRYSEAHHVFHLSKNPPDDALEPKHLIVLCATCHRRMHYADIGVPIPTDEGWCIRVDGKEYSFKTT